MLNSMTFADLGSCVTGRGPPAAVSLGDGVWMNGAHWAVVLRCREWLCALVTVGIIMCDSWNVLCHMVALLCLGRTLSGIIFIDV